MVFWVFPFWLPFLFLCEDLKMAGLLWNSWLLPPSSAPTFPLSLYPSLLFGMKEPHFFLFFPFWPSFSCLTGSETRIQPQSSDPQKGCRISDNIKEQIRQSVRELAKRGWSQVLGIILYMGEKKMTMWARRMGLYGKREAVHNSTACLLPHGWVVAVEIW